MKKESKTIDLAGEVALITGASRGIGKGIAIALASLGAKVYITGRNIDSTVLVDGLPGTIHQTAMEITDKGGVCIPMQCDHSKEEEIKKVFDQLQEKENKLNILVNNAWAGYQGMMERQKDEWVWTWDLPFWQQPLWRYDAMMNTTLRSNFICSQLATRMMLKQQDGLIVNLSFWAAQLYIGNVPYGVVKAATDKMTSDMAQELQAYNITVVSLYPGLVRTEGVLRGAAHFDLSNSESVEYQGLAIAHLYKDQQKKTKSGTVLVSAALGQEYNFSDIDDKKPSPINMKEELEKAQENK